jgi:hypothetical protein
MFPVGPKTVKSKFKKQTTREIEERRQIPVKLTFPTGEYYIGQVRSNNGIPFPHGNGVSYWKDGIKFYDGTYVNGKKEGWGVFYWRNGHKLYEGEVNDN